MTAPTSPDLDSLSLSELVGRLRDVHTARTPLGWPTDDAVTKSRIERHIFEMIARRDCEPVDDPAQRLACEVDVKVSSAKRASIKRERVMLQPGGLFIETDAPIEIGEPVEIEIALDGPFRLRTRGNVGFRAHGKEGSPPGIGVGFASVVGESAERRLERLVLELIKNRVS